MSSEDTRTRLVLTAMRLFHAKGYNSTSVADVLHSAGVNSGSLYHFFPGKQDLLLAVLDAYQTGIGPLLLEPAWREVHDPIERVFALLAAYRAALLASDCSYGCPIGSLALELHEPDEPVRERLAANFRAWTQAVQQCLEEAGERLPATVARPELAAFVLATMEGAVMQARTYRNLSAFDGAVGQLRRHFAQLQRAARTRKASRQRKPSHQKRKHA